MDFLKDIIFLVHLTSLAVAALGILVADKIGFSWMRGVTHTIAPRTLEILHNILSYALTGLILSGLYLFWPLREYLLYQPAFLLKLGFVALLVVNSVVIDRTMELAVKMPFATVKPNVKAGLLASGALSFVCWLGAGISALVVFGF